METMKAIEIREPGAPDVLRLTDRPVPVPKTGEVRIKVMAAGVNRPDLLQRLGKYPPPPGITDIPGLEVAGIVDAIGPDAACSFEMGAPVCALLAGGGYAEYVVAPVGQVLRKPENLDFIQAAALPEAVFTVWNNVFHRGGFKAGESILIHGGASGIGTTAIQMCRAMGARKIIVTVGTDSKAAACRTIGADVVINYKTQDFEAETLNVMGGRGVDMVLDMVGGDYVPKNLGVLAEDGRHVSIATLHGPAATVDIRKIMARRLVLTGSTLRPRPVHEKSILKQEIESVIWPLIEKIQIKPLIHKTFPISQTAQAHAILEQGDHIGKIVLTI